VREEGRGRAQGRILELEGKVVARIGVRPVEVRGAVEARDHLDGRVERRRAHAEALRVRQRGRIGAWAGARTPVSCVLLKMTRGPWARASGARAARARAR
jgi:hypothetical protein